MYGKRDGFSIHADNDLYMARMGYVMQARARNTDPATSAAAARGVERSGGAALHRDRCLNAVKRHPGATAAEIADITGLERHTPSRRLPELRAGGFVVNGGRRKCKVMGRDSLTWYPAGPLQLCLF